MRRAVPNEEGWSGWDMVKQAGKDLYSLSSSVGVVCRSVVLLLPEPLSVLQTIRG